MTRSPLSQNILNRFLKYVAIDTMSDPHITDHRPTSDGQIELLRLLEAELRALGIGDIVFDPKGYLVARIPSNLPKGKSAPTIGFMAHVDVADDVAGNGVKARVIDSYDGNDIVLNREYSIMKDDNPLLAGYIGQQLVVTDGTTLLGGDDKAGVAILMALAERLVADDAIGHGEVELVFTSDEETGSGMDAFDVGMLRSRCCYTIDGGERGEIEAECFNAATVEVDFQGIPYHLGAARGRMVNSVSMAVSFIASLPRSESPEATDGRYGYYCAEEIKGSSIHTHAVFYLRDFELDGLERRIDVLRSLATTTEKLFSGGKVEVNSKIVYQNMYEAIKKDPAIMDAIWKAGEKLGVKLHEKIIRGGTDGARLAQMGIPAPNLYTGSHNLHSRFEWVAVGAMEESALLVEQIIAHWAGVDD
ncbi:MAG: peptidase T [Spirochaetae bacterium HGW-Spirochaetae-4]|nr:MAG: peptidase T [Spirochaetes bacterium GWC2_52_13]PKL20476.1 MAG: peptidase T [Spirochaetae bacterium HGW-Spirochaetae-4]